jgi:hypothetical protein
LALVCPSAAPCDRVAPSTPCAGVIVGDTPGRTPPVTGGVAGGCGAGGCGAGGCGPGGCGPGGCGAGGCGAGGGVNGVQ